MSVEGLYAIKGYFMSVEGLICYKGVLYVR